MNRLTVTLVAVALTLAAIVPAAGAEDRPIQLSLFNPAQIFPEDDSIKGVRLNLIYGKNVDVSALDVGIANHATGDFKGLQYGVVGLVNGDAVGWQDCVVNIVDGKMQGLQWGAFNKAGSSEGVQAGLVNITESHEGIMLGFFNMTEKMNGLQIGLINVINDKESLPILPIVNWQF